MDGAVVPGSDMVISGDRRRATDATATAAIDDVRALLDAVTDPEIPVLTIADIGILRDVSIADDGHVTVTITPTYSGCPAMAVIEQDILATLEAAGYDASVTSTFRPPWTTEWMTDSAKAKLVGFGIAAPRSTLSIVEDVRCPQCRSGASREVSAFGSTACKRLMVCTSCGEPFDHFKEI